MRASFVSFCPESGAMFEDSFVNSDGFWMLQESLALDEASQGVYA